MNNVFFKFFIVFHVSMSYLFASTKHTEADIDEYVGVMQKHLGSWTYSRRQLRQALIEHDSSLPNAIMALALHPDYIDPRSERGQELDELQKTYAKRIVYVQDEIRHALDLTDGQVLVCLEQNRFDVINTIAYLLEKRSA